MNLLKITVVPAVMCLTLSAATALHAQERMRHVGEYGDCCIWAVRYAQQLL